MKPVLSHFKASTRSLKSQLALYFVPATLLPIVGLSYYATHVFEKSSQQGLFRQANSESTLILSEMSSIEKNLGGQLKRFSNQPDLIRALAKKDVRTITSLLTSFRNIGRLRIYDPEGDFIAEGPGDKPARPRINFIPRDSLKKIKNQNLSVERYFSEDGSGLLILGRALLQDENKLYGVLEQEYLYGASQLADFRNKRQVEAVLIKRDFSLAVSGIAIGKSELSNLSKSIVASPAVGGKSFYPIWLGENRYASYLYDVPDISGKKTDWAYLSVLLPLSSRDEATRQLRWNIIYITVFLVLGFGYLIVVFSNRVVKPIEVLVTAMKRVKTGNMEEIPSNDSSYEIDYLISAFNDMIRNVSVTRKALESKLSELKQANTEIRNTQTTLVQSAKMISLGQIVAGVAHELNNPVAFIYSNMHHLSTYIEKVNRIISEYRARKTSLPQSEKEKLESLERELDIDFIMSDMADLTKSCLDGANRTKDIVTGLRTFSRIEESVFKFTDLHEGIQSTLRLLSAEFKNRIMVHQEFGTIPKVECSPSQINQVFMNLLANAAQAISGRGNIWIRTRDLGDCVEIQIEDSGSGMSPETISQIFVPFFTTKKVGEGTGLGLSIAYGLIQKHHGKIDVKSEIGKGTVFTILLPVQQKVEKAG
ncbi:MAG: ATP-binding protein [Pseudomonadota bacterium]